MRSKDTLYFPLDIKIIECDLYFRCEPALQFRNALENKAKNGPSAIGN